MKLARPLQNLIDAFQRLPGVGPKSAQRLAFYMLHVPQSELDQFAESLINLKKLTIECSRCHNIAEDDPCPICLDDGREDNTICVVEQPIDILSFEKSGTYKGQYHVLHGRIDPLNNVRPEDLRISSLVQRASGTTSKITEVILALNPDMEGEATAMYITKKLQSEDNKIKVTRLAYGLPTGASIEYADEITLSRALEGRREV